MVKIQMTGGWGDCEKKNNNLIIAHSPCLHISRSQCQSLNTNILWLISETREHILFFGNHKDKLNHHRSNHKRLLKIIHINSAALEVHTIFTMSLFIHLISGLQGGLLFRHNGIFFQSILSIYCIDIVLAMSPPVILSKTLPKNPANVIKIIFDKLTSVIVRCNAIIRLPRSHRLILTMKCRPMYLLVPC